MSKLIDFLEDQFLPLQQLDAKDERRYRNAVRHSARCIGRPAELVDIAQPGFRQEFLDYMEEQGATLRRASTLWTCLRQLRDAMRAEKQLKLDDQPIGDRVADFVSDNRERILLAMVDLLDRDDQVLAHGGNCFTVQEQIDSIQESEASPC